MHSSIAIILMGKRELVALLNLSSWCLVMVERLFLAVPWGCLRFVIVVFPDHTHYFRYKYHMPTFGQLSILVLLLISTSQVCILNGPGIGHKYGPTTQVINAGACSKRKKNHTIV